MIARRDGGCRGRLDKRAGKKGLTLLAVVNTTGTIAGSHPRKTLHRLRSSTRLYSVQLPPSKSTFHKTHILHFPLTSERALSGTVFASAWSRGEKKGEMPRLMVISPHPGDAELGMGSYLLQAAQCNTGRSQGDQNTKGGLSCAKA